MAKNKIDKSHQEEASVMSGREAGQMKSVPFEAAAHEGDAQKQAIDMATPKAPADDKEKSDEEKEEEAFKAADAAYAEHSTNPSAGLRGQSAPPEAAEVLARKDVKAGKVILRVKVGHPRGEYRVGKHVVGRQFQEFEFSEDEAKEANGEGGKAWLDQGDAAQAAADKKLQEEIRNAQGSAASDI